MAMLKDLEPKSVFYFFEEICKIPHGSGNVGAISDYLADFAKKRGLSCIQDGAKNIMISKEATAGYEKQEGIILQGHMDMVAVKKEEYAIDMKKDGLKLCVEGDDVYAEGTSLGGDDGIAVAYALAILDDDSIPHPHLDVILTVDEETGMDGAKAIDLSSVKGTRLLNLDSEEEGIFLAGCAGGASVKHHFPVEREEKTGTLYRCRVCGLQGGHSGAEIDKERGNAIVLTGRLLYELLQKAEIGVCGLEGGLADNAIPREAKLEFLVKPEEEEKTEELIAAFEKVLQKELSVKDPGVRIETEKTKGATALCLTEGSAGKVGMALTAMPNGVQAMSADIAGLVQTSLNHGIVKLEEGEAWLVTSLRSSVSSEKEALLRKVCAVTKLAGGRAEVYGEYPGWEYRKQSPFRELCIRIYEEMYGKKPEVQVIHAGLECGLLLEKKPELDCISMGPDIRDIHTTEERLSISSVQRVWEYLLKVLAVTF